MRLIWINILAWLFFHFSISLSLMKLSDRFFQLSHPLNGLFKERPFEKNGTFWRDCFLVHKWKDALPDGASLFRMGYKKKKLPETRKASFQLFIKETKRAELTHWMLILPAPLFFFWNPVWAGWLMIVYALLANVPFILIQRYNRIRLSKVAQRLK
ncbi:Glycosyl-4,4'-diaponeurosporenoate acyltransferase precursor [Alkalibacterium sp. AK22]|uniref:glycosyl-4,4'-diaponeurosporenoate acyltransferase CrtO family protein n=1 Tax=Alkalibacterium sp. AK22 TaxID=1229520 RepID=UPI000445CAFB|nr:glycosyl-4,4'-diaponeurosporenoate acyltransferase [Alkalibacterium sp. AK22]EXJ23195.1 Glycosyl-4,4'-diaponeurosporenoate acyltransferase precursor [Alkalibacterium sp. AK22]